MHGNADYIEDDSDDKLAEILSEVQEEAATKWVNGDFEGEEIEAEAV